jgi:hypothetical protein
MSFLRLRRPTYLSSGSEEAYMTGSAGELMSRVNVAYQMSRVNLGIISSIVRNSDDDDRDGHAGEPREGVAVPGET